VVKPQIARDAEQVRQVELFERVALQGHSRGRRGARAAEDWNGPQGRACGPCGGDLQE
jgi:hypothetical protein